MLTSRKDGYFSSNVTFSDKSGAAVAQMKYRWFRNDQFLIHQDVYEVVRDGFLAESFILKHINLQSETARACQESMFSKQNSIMLRHNAQLKDFQLDWKTGITNHMVLKEIATDYAVGYIGSAHDKGMRSIADAALPGWLDLPSQIFLMYIWQTIVQRKD